ncbi:MAG: sigma-70 family RNA polymerase sigma factor [Labilithrix sp.]
MSGDHLLQRIAAGDGAAATTAVQHYGTLVWSLARRYTRGRDEAEDAVQEIFVDLLESASRFDPERGTESGFVAMIARRRLIDLARRRAVRAIESTTEGKRGSDPGATPLDEQSIARAMRADEAIDAKTIARAIDQLPPEEREVLVLATLGGRSYAEIATMKDLPLGTVKTYGRRGLLRVRAALTLPDAPPPPKPGEPRRAMKRKGTSSEVPT